MLPNWTDPDARHRLVTLDAPQGAQALPDSPYLARALRRPLSMRDAADSLTIASCSQNMLTCLRRRATMLPSCGSAPK